MYVRNEFSLINESEVKLFAAVKPIIKSHLIKNEIYFILLKRYVLFTVIIHTFIFIFNNVIFNTGM